MNIDLKSTLHLEPLEAIKFETLIGNEKVGLYITPRMRDIKIDFIRDDKWMYEVELTMDQTLIHRHKRSQSITIQYKETHPKLDHWDFGDKDRIELPKEFNQISGIVSEMELNEVQVNGLLHQLYLKRFGDKLNISLNKSTSKGAPRQNLYSLIMGPKGMGFERAHQGDIQSLQKIIDAEKIPGNYQNGQLVWRSRPSFDPGYGDFTL